MNSQTVSDWKSVDRVVIVWFVLLSIAITPVAGMCESRVANRDWAIPASPARDRKFDDLEIRLAFTSLDPNFDDSTAPLFIAIRRDGRVRALRYGLRYHANNIAAYEGVLPEAETAGWFARVRAAFELPKHRADYDRRLAYESDSFYLSLLSRNDQNKEMFGSLETRPEAVRALVDQVSKLWSGLSEVPPAYAYLLRRPIEKNRLRVLITKYKDDLTPIESFPAALQSLLISVVTKPLDFYPLTQPQYNQLKAGKLAVTYKTKGYELTLFLSAKELKSRIRGNDDEDLTETGNEAPRASNQPFHRTDVHGRKRIRGNR